MRGRLIAALIRGGLERALERDVSGPCRARIYHCVSEKQRVAVGLVKLAIGAVGVTVAKVKQC